MFEARAAGGPFGDLFDFATRVDAKRLNKGVLEALVQCGAFDSVLEPMGITRARAYAAVDRALERSRSASRDRERGQTTCSACSTRRAPTTATRPRRGSTTTRVAVEWDRLELLAQARSRRSGCYVSGHPLFRYGRASCARIGAARQRQGGGAEAVDRGQRGRHGRELSGEASSRAAAAGKAAFFEIEDMSGRVKAKLRGDRIDTYAPLLTSGEPVLVQRAR